MRMTFALCVSIAIIQQTAAHLPAQDAPVSKPAVAENGNRSFALEQKLLGTWYGPACGGDYTFNPDNTFIVRHFSPGNNTLTGTWLIRWDALPPKLLLTYKTSDIRKRDPDRIEFDHLSKTSEPKILKLNDEFLVYQFPGEQLAWQLSRKRGEGGTFKRVK